MTIRKPAIAPASLLSKSIQLVFTGVTVAMLSAACIAGTDEELDDIDNVDDIELIGQSEDAINQPPTPPACKFTCPNKTVHEETGTLPSGVTLDIELGAQTDGTRRKKKCTGTTCRKCNTKFNLTYADTTGNYNLRSRTVQTGELNEQWKNVKSGTTNKPFTESAGCGEDVRVEFTLENDAKNPQQEYYTSVLLDCLCH